MWTSGIEQILMAYLAVIVLDKDWEGKRSWEAVLCQNLAHPLSKAHAMPCNLLSKRELGPIKNLEYLNLYCMPLSWAGYQQMAEGETMLEVR